MTRIDLVTAAPWLRKHQGATFVVKAGGDLLNQPEWADAVASDIAVLHRLGLRIVLVHGGGPQLDAAAERLGIATRRVAGRRVTTPQLLDAAIMEWRGRLSLQWVTALGQHGERAMGISGADAGLLTADKRPAAVVTDDQGERVSVDYGLVGDVRSCDPVAIEAMLDAGIIPVVSPLAGGPDGVLNVNADTVAAEIAVAVGAARLLLLTRAPGIQTDPEDPSTALHQATLGELDALEQAGALKAGMRPKVASIRRAIGGGVGAVHVLDGTRPGALVEELFTTEGVGTLVQA